ncbi:MAG: hypothetical protein NC080_07265 [Paraprevotella sp.]|nr:hypothetical protein [Paraprevotella sp.]
MNKYYIEDGFAFPVAIAGMWQREDDEYAHARTRDFLAQAELAANMTLVEKKGD